MIGFKIAYMPEDYKAAHDLLLKEGFFPQELDYPTVMVFDGEELIGMITTSLKDDMVVAGPLVMKSDKRRLIAAVKLAEAYEATLRGLGIESFIFWAEEQSGTASAVLKFDPKAVPYAKKGNRLFWLRKLDDGRRRSISTGTKRGRTRTAKAASGNSKASA